MPRQNTEVRFGSAACGGGMLALWVTMRLTAWLEREYLPCLPPPAAAALGLILQAAMLALPLWLTLALLRRPAAVLCPLQRGRNATPWLLPAGIFLLLAANLLGQLLHRLLTGSGVPAPYPSAGGAPMETVLCFLSRVVVPAVLEELLFRGAVLQGLRPAGDRAALLCSALLFMAAHGSLSQWIPACAAGLLLGVVTLQTGTLRWAILLHLCNNLVAYLTAYHPGPVTTGLLLALLLLGAVSLLFLRRRPQPALSKGGRPRQLFTVPLALSLVLLLSNALFFPAA